MNLRSVVACVVHSQLLMAATVAQCPSWTAVGGFGAHQTRAMLEWDPDGAGPLGAALVVAGGFASAGHAVGTSRIALWDGDWRPFGSGLNGDANALCEFEGRLIAGGEFTHAGGLPADRVAAWDGSAWVSLPGVFGAQTQTPSVRALAVFEGALYVGGRFDTIDGIAMRHIARWDGLRWSSVGDGVDAEVRALHVFDGVLIVGGSFHAASGTEARHVASWDGEAWAPVGTGQRPGAPNEEGVYALATHDGRLTAGGRFSTLGSASAANVAQWSGEAWAPLGAGLTSAIDPTVYALLSAPDGLYAAGQITASGSDVVMNSARWDGAHWTQAGDGLYGAGMSLALHDGTLYVGGIFGQTQAKRVHGVAKLDDGVWNPLGFGFSDRIHSVAVFGSELFVGGEFLNNGVVPLHGIATWNGVAWGQPGAGLGAVRCLLTHGDALYAGGSFYDRSGQIPVYTHAVAHWTGKTWTPLEDGSTADVQALASLDGALFAAGRFKSPAGGIFPNIARWEINAWVPITPLPFVYSFHALAVWNDRLIVGITPYGPAQFVSAIWQWDGVDWTPLGQGLTNLASVRMPKVLALLVHEGTLYAAGEFSEAGSTPLSNIARWDGADWAPVGVGLSPIVRGLGLYSGDLIASAPNGGPWRWNQGEWLPLTPQTNSAAASFAIDHGELVAGGSFTRLGDHPSASLARWRNAPGDADGDNDVTFVDLARVLENYGRTSTPGSLRGDVNNDGVVDFTDLILVLAHFGQSC